MILKIPLSSKARPWFVRGHSLRFWGSAIVVETIMQDGVEAPTDLASNPYISSARSITLKVTIICWASIGILVPNGKPQQHYVHPVGNNGLNPSKAHHLMGYGDLSPRQRLESGLGESKQALARW